MERAETAETMVGNGASEPAWELQRFQGALRRKTAEIEVPADSL